MQCAWFALFIKMFVNSGWELYHMCERCDIYLDVHMWVCLSINSIQHVGAFLQGKSLTHFDFQIKSFQCESCETSSFQLKVTWRIFICQRQLWDAPYLFFPCLTSSSSSFFRNCPISIIHLSLDNSGKKWDFCSKSNVNDIYFMTYAHFFLNQTSFWDWIA